MANTQYCTPQQLTLAGLPAEALDGVSFDVESHIEFATAHVDSYLRGRYSVPLSQPYALEIVLATAVIAAWNIVNVRGYDPENGTDRMIRVRYEDTINWLVRIADAKVNLAGSSDTSAGVFEGGPSVRSRGRGGRGRCGHGAGCGCSGRRGWYDWNC